MDDLESSPLLLGNNDTARSAAGRVSIHPVAPSYQNALCEAASPSLAEDEVDRKYPSFRESPPSDEISHRPKVYASRVWILSVFSFLAMFQCVQWNSWGPISESVNEAYSGWGSGTVAMMANWGTITFVIFIFPMCWLMNYKGLRTGVFTCSLLIASGTVIRILPFIGDSTELFTVGCHFCAILNGIAGTLVMAAPPMIAAEWFPPKERTTATAISQIFNQLGNAGSYLEPLIVRSPADGTPSEIRSDIKVLMYIGAGIAVALLVTVYLYYPSKPPTPPSVSSSMERLEFRDSIKKLLRNRDVILLTLSYGISVGVPSAWFAVLNYSLKAIDIHQDDAMWIGLVAVFSGAAVGLLVGRFTDLIYGYVRISVIVLMIGALSCFFWFYLLTNSSIPVVKWQVYFSIVGGLSCNYATSPLFFELAVESAYPAPEILVGGLLTGMNNLIGLSFLFIFLIPNMGMYLIVLYGDRGVVLRLLDTGSDGPYIKTTVWHWKGHLTLILQSNPSMSIPINGD
ncbi:Solute carrier 49 member 4 [Halocaridina rubra]|uniref:Solute carrier 49 member 4 n=1 Tax=Halocaridina rubra TaxID=373956 RepID=A0AAN8WVV2_HALRR